ncbi:MAG: phosphoribosylglycinamide formyltransferase [Candidatus Viridilinea halotolerans]|uniref:Phosphoribosylglycinamide formyltransferase n=1 Tax=Candidatus Viridilinea halotolerans TaxID=2491704 RepID=A0A426UBQ0_9CHLR|nr:MAG: phosphoribosylglycinamide formyltransferase [Candidatus Viridilinea halotolerans]
MSYAIAVLLSGSGSNLQALIDAQHEGNLGHTQICLVVSDQAEAYGLQRALVHQIPSAYLPLRHTRQREQRRAMRAAWEQRLATLVQTFTPDLVILAGFMRILSPLFLEQFPERVINQHPALLPDDGGASYTTSSGLCIPTLRGAHVVSDALAQQLPVTGCTIHRVTPRVDDGPVLARTEVPILPHDNVETLHERIKLEERRMIVEVVNQLSQW